ncbi:MAG: ABC transporter permease [Terriglobales bacterium]
MATAAHSRNVCVSEILGFAVDTFCANKIRFLLTALGMVIGTASLILVVTIGLTGKQYVLSLIQSVGANMVYVEYGGPGRTGEPVDLLTLEDMHAVQQQVLGIRAASPMIELRDTIAAGFGRTRDIMILGVSPDYRYIRNLDMLAGRMFDEQDTQARNKVAVLQQQLAKQLYGSEEAAVGQTIRLSGLPFMIIGTFKERVQTFGMSEVSTNTVLIPYTVARYFTNTDYVKQLFFSTHTASEVPQVTNQIQRLIQSRHRPESVFRTENLTELLKVAAKSANALTAVLLLVATVTLIVSGVGIMNIMLATVSARIREIGIRKAVGATSREIRWQFLSEAIFISLIGGLVGIIIGLALPFGVRWFTDYRIPISGLSVIIALVVSSFVGILFGTVPAARAANLDPVESLRYE